MLSLSSIKTPGVYVDEVPKFPPSVAAVETAIPAFIGYTEKAQNIKPGDLLNVPTKVGSLAEYEEKFGGGATPQVANVTIDAANNFKSAELTNQFYMYDSLRLFYANGGGDCYIVSVATYGSAAKSAAEFTSDGTGIKALEKEDRPTILLFPDNSLLTTGSDYYTVYDTALLQCANLKDRVGVFDVKENDPNGTDFRSGVGVNNLKYGAAYTPWLQVNFPKNIKYRDFKSVLFKETTSVTLAGLATDAKIQTQITEYDQVLASVDAIHAATDTLNGTKNTLRERYIELEAAYQGAKTGANMQALVNFMFDVARQLDTLVGGTITNTELNDALKGVISSTMKGIFTTLISHDKELEATVTGGAYNARFDEATVPTATEWGNIFGVSAPPASSVIPGSATNNTLRMDSMLPSLQSVFDTIDAAWQGSVVGAGSSLETQKHDSLLDSFPIYKTIITGIQNTNTYVPPSGAVAGIYAYVDRTRGVWKAPANVSVTGVIGPKDRFTSTELDALNMDVNAGKSINAIRSFTGKGTLIFGARTLAGNDAEWRYVSVRRFFNMVEESVKKASEQFVFEPNDANTWIKVQAMIENFLNMQWRAGALQGAKPEHAYYVAVGLGKTMTPQHILDGFMLVEIGMAVVRPAEFIVLRFSHKMAES